MYLYIFEDGEIRTSNEFSTTDKICCNNGILTVLDITNNKQPTEYYQGEWHEIEEYKEDHI